MITQYGHVCRPVRDAPRLKVVRDKTLRSAKVREEHQRCTGFSLCGPARQGSLPPQVADPGNVNGTEGRELDCEKSGNYQAMFCVFTVCGLPEGNVPSVFLKRALDGLSGKRWAYMGVAAWLASAGTYSESAKTRGGGDARPPRVAKVILPHTRCGGGFRRGGVAGAEPPHKGGPNRPDRPELQWSVVSGQ